MPLVPTAGAGNGGQDISRAIALGTVGDFLGVDATVAETQQGIELLARQLENLGNAKGPKAQAEVFHQIRGTLDQVTGGIGKANDATFQLYTDLTNAEQAALRLAAAEKQVAEAARAPRDRQGYDLETDVVAADALLIKLQEEAALRKLINTYGAESVQVARARAAAERAAMQEIVDGFKVSQDLKIELMAAYDAAQALAGVDFAAAIAAGVGQAIELYDWLAAAAAVNLPKIRDAFVAGATADLRGPVGMGDSSTAFASPRAAALARAAAEAEAFRNRRPTFPSESGDASGSAGGGGTDAIQAWLDKQRQELDLLRATDPVQKEMIRNRDLLAQATDAQRAAMEAAIRTGIEERAEIESTNEAWAAMGNVALQTLEDILLSGKSATDVIADLGKMLLKATLQAAVLGKGPLAGFMGTAAGGGLMGGLKSLFGGGAAAALAGGGMISGPGTGTSDDIPIWASDGEFMVNAKATAKHRDLLEAINSGAPLPMGARKFAGGGFVSGVPMSGHSGGFSAGERNSGGGNVIHYHFNITTPNAKSFAEDRIAVARGAGRLVAQAGRYS